MLRAVVLSVVAALLFAPVPTRAQPAGKVPRIGILLARANAVGDPLYQAFQQRLRELGYIEGQNVAIDLRRADGRLDRLPDLRPNWSGSRRTSSWPT